MTTNKVIQWLLEGDVSIQYQVYRDLLGVDKPRLRDRISSEGWGRQFLLARQENGHWGRGFYQPKWTSSHYTLLDLKNLGISPRNKLIADTLAMIFSEKKGADGGIYPIGTVQASDVCINGMVLNYASYFKVNEAHLRSLVDFLLSEQMKDGGFNCLSNTKGAIHSSLHSTLSVLEGILEYETNGYTYRLHDLQRAAAEAREFMLIHKLFRSHKTGLIIKPEFLKLCYPCRWHYDILKAMDYFFSARIKYDPRMNDALDNITKKRTVAENWKLAAAYPGQIHFKMEKAGEPSRWNTLRAMRVLSIYGSGLQ